MMIFSQNNKSALPDEIRAGLAWKGWMKVVFRLGVMAALPMLAFSKVEFLYFLVLFPVVLSFAKSRVEVGALALAYFMSAGRDLFALVDRFFDHPSMLMIVGLPLGLAVILTLPWLIFDPRSEGFKKPLLFLVSLFVFTVFPVGYLAWHNPLLSAAVFYPGAGIVGIVCTAMILAGLTNPRKTWIILVVCVGFAGYCNVKYDIERERALPVSWFGLGTNLGQISADMNKRRVQMRHLNEQITRSIKEGARVIFLPESVAILSPALEVQLAEAIYTARMHGATILLGVEIPEGAGGWRNAIVDLETMRVLDESRFPMPAGVYRVKGGAPIRPFASDIVEVAGKKIGMSICYEDLVIWPHYGLLAQESDLMASVSNAWSLDLPTVHAQQVSGDALARIAGVARVVAINGKAL